MCIRDSSNYIVLPGRAIWISQRRPPFTAHRAVFGAGKTYPHSLCLFSQEVLRERNKKNGTNIYCSFQTAGRFPTMVGCPRYGVWQYMQHGGLKPSPHTPMSSAPELHINDILSANNDSRNEGENPKTATGWWLQQASCVFWFLASSSRRHFHWSLS